MGLSFPGSAVRCQGRRTTEMELLSRRRDGTFRPCPSLLTTASPRPGNSPLHSAARDAHEYTSATCPANARAATSNCVHAAEASERQVVGCHSCGHDAPWDRAIL